ncbi:MAG: carboxypeptidase regulatory-like domain-containing protein, partial [Acetobacteraceae bacterium]|nr:carboxypeptidase regulatory-like domain-containing protein [Acetobacteraceae bacterium]
MIRRVIVLAFALAAGIFGQDPYGHIIGRIADPSGAPVPGATVRAMNPDTNVTVTSQSDSAGNYEVRNLIP